MRGFPGTRIVVIRPFTRTPGVSIASSPSLLMLPSPKAASPSCMVSDVNGAGRDLPRPGFAIGAEWLGLCERAVGAAIEIVCAILLGTEIVILFMGVVARYALHRP